MSQLERISFCLPIATEMQAVAFHDLRDLINPESLRDNGKESHLPRLEILEEASPIAFIATDGIPRISFSNSAHPSVHRTIQLHDIVKKFQGHIVRVDHMGVNLPAEDPCGRELLALLSQSANIYGYPGGEPWYFTVPATEAELHHEITDFSQIRFPKFELVLEGSESTPHLIQMDLVTDLSREEVEARLPLPFGVALLGLDGYFRSVYVDHPWAGFLLRMDFRYHTDGLINEWATCEWLVKNGERFN